MPLSYHSEIDEFLGLRDSRYFGNGYLNSVQSIDNFKIDDRGDSLGFTCNGHVTLPEMWSEKRDGRQIPHLSTIDVVELSLECLRKLLHRTMHSHQLPANFIRRISIIAGNNPVESGLDTIAITGCILHVNPESDTLHLEIANMVVDVTFSTAYWALSSYTTFCHRPVAIKSVMVNVNDMTASAVVDPLATSLAETWSVSSCFAAALQLGQTLLYKQDGISRAESNTLWMKRTVINLSPNLPPFDIAQPIFVRLDGARRYTKTDGDWRRADIFAIFCNTNIICSVTHRLPNKATH